MKQEHEQDCPLCGKSAHYILVDYDNRKYFRCDDCTYYQISVGAEKRLASAPQEWRDSYARKARSAPENEALVIRIPPPDPNAIPGCATTAISGQYELRSSLPDWHEQLR